MEKKKKMGGGGGGEIISKIVHPIIPPRKKCNLKADLNIKFNTYHIIIVTIIIHHWLDTLQNSSPINNSEPIRFIFSAFVLLNCQWQWQNPHWTAVLAQSH